MTAHDLASTASPDVVQLRFRSPDWERLHSHLFPGDGGEHGAVLLCGQVVIEGMLRLLVREVVPAIEGVDYVPGTRGHRHLDGRFVTRQLRRAKDAGLVYLAVHNHGGQGRVAFSRPDLDSHERAYPTLLSVSGSPVGGLVLADGALAGDVWMPNGSRLPVHVTVIVGESLESLDDGYAPRSGGIAPPARQYARQALVFGDAGQERLAQMQVAVVGAGGVGMLVIQALARLGVGHFVVVDPDRVSASNLSRLPEARRKDATGRIGDGRLGQAIRRLGRNRPAAKVDLAARIIRGANPLAQVSAIAGDVADDAVARRLVGCDFMFLAADSMLARDVVNQIAYQYLIPTLQVGSKVVVEPHSGDVRDIYGVVRSLGVEPGCLRCNELVNMTRLAEEAVATAEQRRNQRYVDEPGIEAPSVITLNSMAVGWAVNDFMHFATGLGRPAVGFRILRSRPVGPRHPQLVVQEPHVDPECHVCGLRPYSVLALGDGSDLPTRTGRG
ncbi:ThiF family adenylyltransferase [Kribbella speibonae]|uniref:ThiF family adenylyltransferase n=1 Tax=Kribbella speibonae TaxID=1572660 RepID=A0ABY2A1E0_9ACTN|nr:ThiF family adenylyltransferase [Kribbella speibonae]TCC20723.1 ThiF family adenylyltransferase [Kribbella speibonae]